LKLVLELIAALVLIAILVRLFESRFAFFPTPGETVTPHEYGLRYEPFAIATQDGERLRGWNIAAPATPLASILYFHGNGGNLSNWAPILAGIAQRGFAVTAFDYRGYGISTGRPTEHGLYRDVEGVVETFTKSVPKGAAIVYWGRSLGVTMAAHAATVHKPAGVILESGFPDARALLRSSPPLAFLGLFSSYRFPTAALLSRLQEPTPTLVMHGDADTVIPFELGRKLFEGIREPKQFVTIRGGDHNDAVPSDPATYWSAVDRFVRSLARDGSG